MPIQQFQPFQDAENPFFLCEGATVTKDFGDLGVVYGANWH
ncbi:hypothetical protein P6709_19980 [Jeotgalibacillus sp. ET6]|nr:hypothetical protein [Jeotgalibacillus sp. ET6]MDG5473988.1 hypothetical protein [Jeotgalibacillus sp. ET6]